MANEEQLRILRQEVKAWNQWRKEHLNETIDLCGANLREANLSGKDLSWASLRGVDLRGMDLIDAILCEANLSEANLSEANLIGADLRGADLNRATLRGAALSEADLRGANLNRADLREAILSEADLREADLNRATLRGATLSETDFREANLSEANLSKANLSEANLIRADLRGADLRETDLRHVNLGRANLRNATITGACLYNTALDDWMIDGIICDYVYWDDKPSFSFWEGIKQKVDKKKKKQWELTHRTPKDRDFRPGEFEELYKQLPTFEYYFEQGFTPLDPLIMDQVVHAINEQRPEIELRLDSLHSRGQPHAVFTVLQKEYVEQALKQISAFYEEKLKIVEGKRDQLLEAFILLTNRPQYAITVGEIIMGDQINKTAERDYFENVTNSQVTTGDTLQDQAQKLIQTPLPQMRQLTTKEELTAHYQLLSEKLTVLRKDYIIESDVEAKFKLKKRIEEYEADLKEIERRLEELESKEDNTNKK